MINFIDILPKTLNTINTLVKDFKRYDKRPVFMANRNLNLNYIMREYGLQDTCQAKLLRDVVEDRILNEIVKQCH